MYTIGAWCGAVKHRPASLAPRWVTTRVFSDESSPHIHMCYSNPQPYNPTQNDNGLSCRCFSSIKKKKKIGIQQMFYAINTNNKN